MLVFQIYPQMSTIGGVFCNVFCMWSILHLRLGENKPLEGSVFQTKAVFGVSNSAVRAVDPNTNWNIRFGFGPEYPPVFYRYAMKASCGLFCTWA